MSSSVTVSDGTASSIAAKRSRIQRHSAGGQVLHQPHQGRPAAVHRGPASRLLVDAGDLPDERDSLELHDQRVQRSCVRRRRVEGAPVGPIRLVHRPRGCASTQEGPDRPQHRHGERRRRARCGSSRAPRHRRSRDGRSVDGVREDGVIEGRRCRPKGPGCSTRPSSRWSPARHGGHDGMTERGSPAPRTARRTGDPRARGPGRRPRSLGAVVGQVQHGPGVVSVRWARRGVRSR